jgi:hypothetical protein
MSASNIRPIRLDIAHIFFLELLRDYKNNLGAALAVRQMIHRAAIFARDLPRQDFTDWDHFLNELQKQNTVLNFWEPELKLYDRHIIATPSCPFGAAIHEYTQIMGGLPNEYAEITEEFNRSTPLNRHMMIGHGSASSPFCAIHQPLRSLAAEKIFVGGQPLQIVALGSKAESDWALAYEYIGEEKLFPEKIKSLLNENLCCFLIKPRSAPA